MCSVHLLGSSVILSASGRGRCSQQRARGRTGGRPTMRTVAMLRTARAIRDRGTIPPSPACWRSVEPPVYRGLTSLGQAAPEPEETPDRLPW